MSWTPLMPAPGMKNAARAAPITVRSIVGGQRCGSCLLVAIRPASFSGLAWLAKGQNVEVALGAGEHAGWVRITPGGPFRLGANGGRGKGVLQLRLPFPPGVEKAARPVTVVEFEYSDRWIEFALPSGWYRAPSADAPDHSAAPGKMVAPSPSPAVAPAKPVAPSPLFTGNATPPDRARQLAAAAAAMAARKAGRG